MISLQSNEIKNHFAEILHKVQLGQEVGITHQGKLVARLLPCQQPTQSSNHHDAIKKLKKFRKHRLMECESITEMREEGRA